MFTTDTHRVYVVYVTKIYDMLGLKKFSFLNTATKLNDGNADFRRLNAVRGIAALVVTIRHIFATFFLRFSGRHNWVDDVVGEASFYAVFIFFILSGFLITHSIEVNALKNEKFRISQFIIARFARLYPPFLYALCVTCAIYILMIWLDLPGITTQMRMPGDIYSVRDFVSVSSTEVWSALQLKQGMLLPNGPLWSFYIEAKIYVLFACMLNVLSLNRVLISLMLFCYVAKLALIWNPEFVRYASVWLTGAVAYYAWYGAFFKSSNYRGLYTVLALLCLIIVADGARYIFGIVDATWDGDKGIWADVLIAAVISCILFGANYKLPFGDKLAPYSYSLYLVHFPILLLFESFIIYFGSNSYFVSCIIAGIATYFVFVVAKIGGVIESKKASIQRVVSSIFNRVESVVLQYLKKVSIFSIFTR